MKLNRRLGTYGTKGEKIVANKFFMKLHIDFSVI